MGCINACSQHPPDDILEGGTLDGEELLRVLAMKEATEDHSLAGQAALPNALGGSPRQDAKLMCVQLFSIAS